MIQYEFLVEWTDEYDDIQDIEWYPPTLDGIRSAYNSAQTERNERPVICLRRDQLDDEGNVVDRAYAYPDSKGNLPETFDSGDPVLQRHRKIWRQV